MIENSFLLTDEYKNLTKIYCDTATNLTALWVMMYKNRTVALFLAESALYSTWLSHRWKMTLGSVPPLSENFRARVL